LSIQTGDAVTYTFMVDLDQTGYFTHNGQQTVIDGTFLADYISGTAIPTDNEPYTGQTASTNWGLDSKTDPYSFLHGSNDDQTGWDIVSVYGLDNIANWGSDPNIVFTGYNAIIWGTDQFINVSSDLTLSSISNTAPGTAPGAVPEPGTIALFSLGLIGLAVFVRRAKLA
jgi:hypothetical protein